MKDHLQKNFRSMGERIKHARIRAGITQEELAEMLNLSRISIARYECGEIIPKVTNLTAMAVKLKVSTDYLLGLENDSFPKTEKLSFSAEAETALEQFVDAILKQYTDSQGGSAK